MTRSKPAELKLNGINRDLIPGTVPPDWWTDGRNVYFKAGQTCRTPGEGYFANAGAIDVGGVRFVHYVDVGAQSYWVYGGPTGIAVTEGTLHWNITPAGWVPIVAKNGKHSIGDIGGVVFVNHPELKPYWWNGNPASIMVPLPLWPATWKAGVMRGHKNFLVAGALEIGGTLQEGLVAWSVSADPGQVPSDWVPSPTNDAGDFAFLNGSGPIVDLLSVRDQLLVAKSHYLGILQYVGGQYVFEGRDVFPSTGLFAQQAWCESGNQVYMITGTGKFVRTDLTSYEDLLYGVLEDHFRRQLNWEYPSACFAWREAESGQVSFGYPTGTNRACTEAITIEVATGRPGIRDLSGVFDVSVGSTAIVAQIWDPDTQSWNSDATTWNEQASGYLPARTVFAAGVSKLLEQGAAETFIVANVVTPVVAWAERKGIDGGGWDYRLFYSGAVPRLKGQAGDTVQIEFSARQTDDGPEVFTGPLPFVIGSGQEQVDFMIEGRLGGFNVSSLGGSVWQLASVIPSARPSGRW